jgi:hypothetical protein
LYWKLIIGRHWSLILLKDLKDLKDLKERKAIEPSRVAKERQARSSF